MRWLWLLPVSAALPIGMDEAKEGHGVEGKLAPDRQGGNEGADTHTACVDRMEFLGLPRLQRRVS